MASPVWRGDDPGFQTKAVRNYPEKADCADKDNIYLSDEGWVYRHYKSLDKSEYWDEVIWAGDVTNPPSENDPVDGFLYATPTNDGTTGGGSYPDPNPTFLVGDGYQFVSGDYPGIDTTIGTALISGASDFDTDVAEAFTVSVSGALANNNTYAWTSQPAGAVFSNATGTFTGNTPNEANTTVTIADANKGTYTLQCLIKTTAASVTGSVGQKVVVASTNVPLDTIGNITITGQATPTAGVAATYTANNDGTAPEGDLTYVWSATPNSGVTITAGDAKVATVTFTSQASVVSTVIACVVGDAEASDGPNQTGNKTVVPVFHIGDVTAAGPTTVVTGAASTAYTLSYTGASSPAANDLTYAWSANPSAGVSFSDAAAATTTVTIAADGSTDITCVVGSVKSEPTSETSNSITLTAAT